MAKVLSEVGLAIAAAYAATRESKADKIMFENLLATIRYFQNRVRLQEFMSDVIDDDYGVLANAARDFLQAFRAHHVFDRTEEFNVTANRLREAEARLASLLGEGEGE